jgi:hypothetical protein
MRCLMMCAFNDVTKISAADPAVLLPVPQTCPPPTAGVHAAMARRWPTSWLRCKWASV